MDPKNIGPRDTETSSTKKQCIQFTDALEQLLASRNRGIYTEIGPATQFCSIPARHGNASNLTMPPVFRDYEAFASAPCWKATDRNVPVASGCSAAQTAAPTFAAAAIPNNHFMSAAFHSRCVSGDYAASRPSYVGDGGFQGSIFEPIQKRRRLHILQPEHMFPNKDSQRLLIPTLARLLGVGPATFVSAASSDPTLLDSREYRECPKLASQVRAPTAPGLSPVTPLSEVAAAHDSAAVSAVVANNEAALLAPSPSSNQVCSDNEDCGRGAAVHAGIASPSAGEPGSPPLPICVRWPVRRIIDLEEMASNPGHVAVEMPGSDRDTAADGRLKKKTAANAPSQVRESDGTDGCGALDAAAIGATANAAAPKLRRPSTSSPTAAPNLPPIDGIPSNSAGNPSPPAGARGLRDLYGAPEPGRILTFCAGNGGIQTQPFNRDAGMGIGRARQLNTRQGKRRMDPIVESLTVPPRPHSPTLEEALLLLSAAEQGAVREATSTAAAAAVQPLQLPAGARGLIRSAAWRPGPDGNWSGAPCELHATGKAVPVATFPAAGAAVSMLKGNNANGAKAGDNVLVANGREVANDGTAASPGGGSPVCIERRAVLNLAAGDSCFGFDGGLSGEGSVVGGGSPTPAAAAVADPLDAPACDDNAHGTCLAAGSPISLVAGDAFDEKTLPEPIIVGVPRTCSDDGSDCASEQVIGIFDPVRYMRRRDCIRVLNNSAVTWVSRSQFEKLCGSNTAKWYRSIRVLAPASRTELESLDCGRDIGRDREEQGVSSPPSSPPQLPLPLPISQGNGASDSLIFSLQQRVQSASNSGQKESLGGWLDRHELPVWKGPNRISSAARGKGTSQHYSQLSQLCRAGSSGNKPARAVGLGAAAAAAAAALMAAEEAARAPAGSPTYASAAVSAVAAAAAAAAAAARAVGNCEKFGRVVSSGAPAPLASYGSGVSALAAAAMCVAGLTSTTTAPTPVDGAGNGTSAKTPCAPPQLRAASSDTGRKTPSQPPSPVLQSATGGLPVSTDAAAAPTSAAAAAAAAVRVASPKVATNIDECIGGAIRSVRMSDGGGVCSNSGCQPAGASGDAAAAAGSGVAAPGSSSSAQPSTHVPVRSPDLREPHQVASSMAAAATAAAAASANAWTNEGQAEIGMRVRAQDMDMAYMMPDGDGHAQVLNRERYWNHSPVHSTAPAAAAAPPLPHKRIRMVPYGAYPYMPGGAPAPSWRHQVVVAPAPHDLGRRSPPLSDKGAGGDAVSPPSLPYARVRVPLPPPRVLHGHGHIQRTAAVAATPVPPPPPPPPPPAAALHRSCSFVMPSGPIIYNQVSPNTSPPLPTQRMVVHGPQERPYSTTCPLHHMTAVPGAAAAAAAMGCSEHSPGGPIRVHSGPRRVFMHYHPYAWRRPEDAPRQPVSPVQHPGSPTPAPVPAAAAAAATITPQSHCSSPGRDAAQIEAPPAPNATTGGPGAVGVTSAIPGLAVRPPLREAPWSHQQLIWRPPVVHHVWPAGRPTGPGYLYSPVRSFARAPQHVGMYSQPYPLVAGESYPESIDYKEEGIGHAEVDPELRCTK
ncbi:hypothetical protein Vretimale_9002 [Volvox reticuliferus]|uniref:Uncharacterized protein n=1 Tax=Volvox reticuliferus TaxID=1737510 RepID=A0A8J4CR93_9CHLO|nr:hypothetical protein Vretifemale_14449 [Volvox reticuliferus]GIM04415.1 hypothetical protein Vretimale_9002 [Volvox reticuliferus]